MAMAMTMIVDTLDTWHHIPYIYIIHMATTMWMDRHSRRAHKRYRLNKLPETGKETRCFSATLYPPLLNASLAFSPRPTCKHDCYVATR
jgi:hypothetical protein